LNPRCAHEVFTLDRLDWCAFSLAPIHENSMPAQRLACRADWLTPAQG
jgi:hypothetical protein